MPIDSTRTSRSRQRCCFVGVLLLVAIARPPAAAQTAADAPSPVGAVAARELGLRRTVQLTGTVRSRRSSLVASEVAGLVAELTVREGDRVRRGEPLVRLRRETIELRLQAAEGQLAEAQARLRLAELRLERSRQLVADEVISVQLFDEALAEHEAWRGRTQQLEAEVARLRDELARSAIPAPFSGIVAREHTALGQWLAVGDPVAELVDLDDLEVELAVPEAAFAALRVGDPAVVRVDGLADVAVTGRVRALVPRADTRSRTYPVKVAFDADGSGVGVGALARVELAVGDPLGVLAVPKDAIVQRSDGTAVFAVRDGRATLVPVDTGISQGTWTEVRGELVAGVQVVVRGNERLRPGQAVVATTVEVPVP